MSDELRDKLRMARGAKPESHAAEEPDNNPTIRLPEGFITMTKDGEYKGRPSDGKIGIKYGSAKTEWLWFSYTGMKKLIDFCTENKETFNQQLKAEMEKCQLNPL